jgi:hypothetical protein
MRGLFDMLDRELPRKGCDHSRRLTSAYLAEHGLASEQFSQWLDKHGGFCDCEVLANVEPFWLELTRRS